MELWGHEYLRNIAGEIGEEWQDRADKGADASDLLELVARIVPYHMMHNAGLVVKITRFACFAYFMYRSFKLIRALSVWWGLKVRYHQFTSQCHRCCTN